MKLTRILSAIIILLSIICSSCNGKSAEDYNTVFEFHDGYAIATYNGSNNLLRYVIINEKYEPVTQEMKFITRISKEFWIAETVSGENVSIDKQQNVIPLSFKFSGYSFVGPHALWAEDSDHNLVLLDLATGKQISKLYSDCYIDQQLDNGTVVIKHKDKRYQPILGDGFAMIDSNGKEIVPFGVFSFIGDFKNGLASYSSTGFGISLSNVTTSKYALANTVNLGAKWFELGDQYGRFGYWKSDKFKQGYINESGEIVIPQCFVYAQPFDEDGFAIVSRASIPTSTGYRRDYCKINKSGKIVKTNIRVNEQPDCTLVEREW